MAKGLYSVSLYINAVQKDDAGLLFLLSLSLQCGDVVLEDHLVLHVLLVQLIALSLHVGG